MKRPARASEPLRQQPAQSQELPQRTMGLVSVLQLALHSLLPQVSVADEHELLHVR